jgi:DNA repair protein RecO
MVFMVLKSDRAFVLMLYPYKERNAVVVLFTEHEGVKRAAVKGVKGRRPRLASTLTPLSEITAHFFEHEKGELVNLSDADLVKSAVPLVLKLPCPAVLDHLVESVMAFVQAGEASPSMYRLLKLSIEALEQGLPWQQVKTYFDFWVLKFNGTLPEFSLCRCGRPAAYWDGEEVKPRCASHTARGIAYPEGFLELVRTMRKSKVHDLPPFEPGRDLYRWTHGVLKDLTLHFTGRPMKSSILLRECDKLFSV